MGEGHGSCKKPLSRIALQWRKRKKFYLDWAATTHLKIAIEDSVVLSLGSPQCSFQRRNVCL